jgi:pimeloyl-ACP methyl ester carboxylesterase
MSAVPDRVDQSVLDDLRARLAGTRRIPLPGGGWDRGTDPDYLAELVAYWANRFDWRTHEDRIRALPWVGATRHGTRSIHQRADDEAAPAVVLLHGWPDSVLRFERVLPMLTDVHVVAPCLPGYPFAEPLTEPGMSTTRMARVVAEIMADLGYDRYVVSGGDVGSGVAEAMASAHPDRVAALHLTNVPYPHLFTLHRQELTDVEREYLKAGRAWQLSEGAYLQQQSTKPLTLAAALGDSPAGLAAWIVEKLRGWSDCNGDVESVFARDDLLTWITAYWVTGAIGSSFSPYVEEADPVGWVDVPTVFTIFAHDQVPPPRALAERFFDIRAWDEQPDGGHFGAWERPTAFAEGIRAAVAQRRR